MLSISVLVPTRNSMSLLPKHIEAMRSWIDLAEEVVAVDSESKDGTCEFLQRELKHANARVLTHPPGLYQSWNFGIAQCRGRYTYISTVGETISRAGLEKLYAAAESFRADVVISPPRMVRMSGEEKRKTWPIHSLIAELRLHAPVAFEREVVRLFAVTSLLRGILGSSASDLYRTDVLQRFPFRTDFGTAGDLAWGLEHAAELCLAVVPETFSTFVFHPKSYAKSDYAVEDMSSKCLSVAREALARRGDSASLSGDRTRRLLDELLTAWEKYLGDKRCVASAKASPIWWLSPAAWSAHRQRHKSLQELTLLQRTALQHLASNLISANRS